MGFTLSGFIKRGLLAAVGRMADYQIILNAAGWLEKGVLTEADLMEIQAAIDAQYVVEEPETVRRTTSMYSAKGDIVEVSYGQSEKEGRTMEAAS